MCLHYAWAAGDTVSVVRECFHPDTVLLGDIRWETIARDFSLSLNLISCFLTLCCLDVETRW